MSRSGDAGTPKVLCFSSFTYSYLDRARTLFQSLRRFHPSWTLVALITDELPGGGQIAMGAEAFDRLVTPHDLAIPDVASWLFGHDIVEACTAVKGPYLLRALSDGTHDVVIYMDPDTCLFSGLDELVRLSASASIVLTPHQTAPSTNRTQVVDDEIGSLKYGIYNLGFIAVARSAEGLRFARWWNDRLLAHCLDAVSEGLFVDQRWCDHVPVFFDGVHILKDEGFNVASWNIAQRPMRFDADGALRAGGKLVRFCHFTKVGSVGDVMLRKNAAGNFEANEVWAWYGRELRRNGFAAVPAGWWAYAAFEDGTAIRPQDRRLYRSRSDLRGVFPDPFASGRGTYQDWLNDNRPSTRDALP